MPDVSLPRGIEGSAAVLAASGAPLPVWPSLTLTLCPAPRSSRGHPGRGIGLQCPRGPLPNPAPDPGLTGLLDSGMW